ncbi:VCBS repeat-containing protein [bacterium]|nr:VCBS repeat-containing protein [bacterium]
MRNKSIGFKIGVVLAGIHFCLVLFCFFAAITSRSSTAGLAFILFFFLDAPLMLLPSSVFQMFGMASPLFLFGVLGSAMWFLFPWLIDIPLSRIFKNKAQLIRTLIIIAFIPVILFGFSRLSRVSMKLSMQRRRPVELKKVLNKSSSDFLIGEVVFECDNDVSINNISSMNCMDNAEKGLMVGVWGYWSGVLFIDGKYQEVKRLDLVGSDSGGFSNITPLDLNGTHLCNFIAYRFSKGAYLFDSNGKERWKFTNPKSNGLYPDGVVPGDIDGDGKLEFAVYYRYGDGIVLLDSEGNTIWQHPILAIGHLEIIDLDEDGKAEIIYSNSNNAYGDSKFNILNPTGIIVGKLEIDTKSSEFSVIRWHDKVKPHILLTEENKIRIVDFDGNDVIQLDAPGCRAFGELKALTVRFNKDEPEYLAVRKSLHPDILVLYVYDYKGNLVYQKTEVLKRMRKPTLAVMPMNEIGDEKLLIGSMLDNRGVVLEYSLNR